MKWYHLVLLVLLSALVGSCVYSTNSYLFGVTKSGDLYHDINYLMATPEIQKHMEEGTFVEGMTKRQCELILIHHGVFESHTDWKRIHEEVLANGDKYEIYKVACETFSSFPPSRLKREKKYLHFKNSVLIKINEGGELNGSKERSD